MARHRTTADLRARGRSAVRWAIRSVEWLVLGAVVGAAAWGALRWAGSDPDLARWGGLAAGVLTAAAAGVAQTMPGHAPADRSADTTERPSPS